MDRKIEAFEYLISRLLEWHKEVTNDAKNDISVLKALKMLFFVSAVDTTITTEDSLLDGVFDNFVAMPYGHVESNVYTNIKNLRHTHLEITNSSSRIDPDFVSTLDSETKEKIDSSIEKLKQKNNNFIKLSSFQLVDLSHRWYSWKTYFQKAQQNSISSTPIPTKIIKNEEKFYSLN